MRAYEALNGKGETAMNTITMNFDDGEDMDAVYTQLKKQYPKVKMTKNDNQAIRAMEELQRAMAGKAEELGFQSEEDAIKWIYEVRDEINDNGKRWSFEEILAEDGLTIEDIDHMLEEEDVELEYELPN